MHWVLWIKALHVISVISWMAGLLYFPRLLVYHSEGANRNEDVHTFIVMQRRLMRAIMNPALISVWITGLVLVWIGGFFGEYWFQLKFGCVIGLTAVHIYLARHRKFVAGGGKLHSSKYYRIINEVPTVLMILIVVLVIVRPF